MSVKKILKTVDRLKADVRDLSEAVWALRDEVITHQATTAAARQPGAARPTPPDRLEELPSPQDSAGYVTTNGVLRLPDATGEPREYRWAAKRQPIEQIVTLPVDETAKILAAIGHRQRLRIVLYLLRASATANDIVNDLSLGTTGAAYHHLNVLQGAGLVEQEQRGTFSIVPSFVPPLLSVFAGLSGSMSIDIQESSQPVEE